MEHDLFGKPVSTFPDHALKRTAMKFRDILPSDAEIETPIADLDVGGVVRQLARDHAGRHFRGGRGRQDRRPQFHRTGDCRRCRRGGGAAPARRADARGRRVRAGRQSPDVRLRSSPPASIRGSRATIAAVTGTSGKTSVAAFTRQIWAALGYKRGEHRHARPRNTARRNLRLAHHAGSGGAASFARCARRGRG